MHQNLILILDGARFAHSTYGLSLELIVGNFHGFQRVRSDQLRREQECQNGHWRTDEELKVRPQCLPKRNSNETKWSIHGYTLQNKTTVLKNPEKWRSETVWGKDFLYLSVVQQLAPAPPKCLYLSHHLFNRCKHQHLRKNCRCRHLLGISWLKIPSLKLAKP